MPTIITEDTRRENNENNSTTKHMTEKLLATKNRDYLKDEHFRGICNENDAEGWR